MWIKYILSVSIFFFIFNVLNLHALEKNIRIAIIGAGSSGITAAVRLKEKGYNNITLFEKADRVGGKSHTIEIEDHHYELGTLWASESYEATLELGNKANVEFREDNSEKWVIDKHGTTVRFNELLQKTVSVPDILRGILHLELTFRELDDLLAPGFFRVRDKVLLESLLKSTEEYAKIQGFEKILEPFRLFMVGCGYGYFEDIPAFYTMKLMKILFEEGKVDMVNGLLGHNLFSTGLMPKYGFQDFWESIVQQYRLNVKLNSQVISIDREKKEIEYQSTIDHCEQNRSTFNYDRIIISALPGIAKKLIKAPTPVENYLLSNTKYLNYFVTLFKAKNLQRLSSYFFKDNAYKNTIGKPIFIINPYDDSDYFVAYQLAEMDAHSLATEGAEQGLRENLARNLKEAVEETLRGRLDKIIEQKHWHYFPHRTISDLNHNYYQIFESIQGLNNTFYVGGLLAFETVEHNIRYSNYLIDKYF